MLFRTNTENYSEKMCLEMAVSGILNHIILNNLHTVATFFLNNIAMLSSPWGEGFFNTSLATEVQNNESGYAES